MSQYQFHAPQISQTNKFILIASGVCFLAGAILKAIGAFSLPMILGLSGGGLQSGMVWQVLSYPFMETQLLGFLFNALLIWFVGSELENLWGRKVYLRFLLLTTLGVALLYSLVVVLFFGPGTMMFNNPVHGLSGLNFALLIAYAMLYPDRQLSMMMIFPMRARTFCWILVGIEAYMAIFSSYFNAWAHLLAMGISYLIIRFQNKPLFRKLLVSSWGESRKSTKKHLYVVKDEDQKPPKYWQ